MFASKKIQIIDEINNEYSRSALVNFKEGVNKYFPYLHITNENADYIIRLIHNKDYYKNKEDIYNLHNLSIPVQHITLEDFSYNLESLKHELLVILNELLIKEDIIQKQISVVHWNESKIWNFIRVNRMNNKSNEYRFEKMTVNKDGRFETLIIDESKLDTLLEYIQLQELCNQQKEEGFDVERIIYTDLKHRHCISKGNLTTLPNYQELQKRLQDSNEEQELSIKEIFDAITLLYQDPNYKKYQKEIKEFLISLQETPGMKIKNSELRKLLKIRTSSGKVINQYLEETRDIIVHPRLKQKESLYRFFNPLFNIKYFYQGDDCFYFIGIDPSNLQLSLHNASPVRKISNLSNVNETKEILKFMSVKFIKNGQYTVLPFPFKYINEIFSK